jgi:hypothetical protein
MIPVTIAMIRLSGIKLHFRPYALLLHKKREAMPLSAKPPAQCSYFFPIYCMAIPGLMVA